MLATNEPTIDTLYTEHHHWLRHWLGKKTGCSHSAADIAQDTYLRLLITGHVPSSTQSRSHLLQIAKGLLIDRWRRHRLESAYLDSIQHLPESESPSAETQALVIETLIEIDRWLDKLPANARNAFLLARLDGLSYREIAERLNVSLSSVEKYIARALVACYRAYYQE